MEEPGGTVARGERSMSTKDKVWTAVWVVVVLTLAPVIAGFWFPDEGRVGQYGEYIPPNPHARGFVHALLLVGGLGYIGYNCYRAQRDGSSGRQERLESDTEPDADVVSKRSALAAADRAAILGEAQPVVWTRSYLHYAKGGLTLCGQEVPRDAEHPFSDTERAQCKVCMNALSGS
jgi:hypothetical protein